MKDKPSLIGAYMAEIMIGLIVWLILLAAKALGLFPALSWAVIGSGFLWIPAACIMTLLVCLIAVRIIRRLQRAATRIYTARTLKQTMHGMTLNSVGPVFGVIRQPGEGNHSYESRIMRTAAKTGKVYNKNLIMTPKPATGAKLDEIAGKYDLSRHKGESDEHLQERVREAVRRRLEEQTKGAKA